MCAHYSRPNGWADPDNTGNTDSSCRPNGWADPDNTWNTDSSRPMECFNQGQDEGQGVSAVGIRMEAPSATSDIPGQMP